MKNYILYNQFKQFVDVIPMAIVKCQMLLDENGQVYDFLFLEANDYVEKITNLNNELIINKSASEIFPDIKTSFFDWIKIFGEAALTCENKLVEQYFELFDKYLKIQLFCYEEDSFYLMILDVTDQRMIRQQILERDRQISYLQNDLKRKAIIDSLTNAYNHQHVIDSLKNQIVKYFENNIDFTVVILDIDDFKKINDKYGRTVGDQVLIDIVSAINIGIRKVDILGRYGCDEFAIILTNVDIDIAKIIVERIKNDIDQYVNDLPGKKVTVSGAALEYNGETLEEYLRSIEQKLLKAKSFGQNIIMI